MSFAQLLYKSARAASKAPGENVIRLAALGLGVPEELLKLASLKAANSVTSGAPANTTAAAQASEPSFFENAINFANNIGKLGQSAHENLIRILDPNFKDPEIAELNKQKIKQELQAQIAEQTQLARDARHRRQMEMMEALRPQRKSFAQSFGDMFRRGGKPNAPFSMSRVGAGVAAAAAVPFLWQNINPVIGMFTGLPGYTREDMALARHTSNVALANSVYNNQLQRIRDAYDMSRPRIF